MIFGNCTDGAFMANLNKQTPQRQIIGEICVGERH